MKLKVGLYAMTLSDQRRRAYICACVDQFHHVSTGLRDGSIDLRTTTESKPRLGYFFV